MKVLCLTLLVSALGCTALTQQRALSATAVAAVAADRANTMAYEARADLEIEAIDVDAGTSESRFAEWCTAMAPIWADHARAECAIVGLADLAVAGQHMLDAGDDLDADWFGAACGILAALTDTWMTAESPPEVLSTARNLVCGISGAHISWDPCDVPPGPPDCPGTEAEVTP